MIYNPFFNIIVAVDENAGFGKDGKIPWHYKKDLKHFKEITEGHICVMGRRTYEDILNNYKNKNTKIVPENFTLLPKRETYVLSRSYGYDVIGATKKMYLREITDDLGADEKREIFILGCEKLFIEAFPQTKVVYMTIVPGCYQCDKKFPINYLMANFQIAEGKKVDELMFMKYVRK